MKFMSVACRSIEESEALFERYYEYLESVKERMLREAYSFAAADWHYDHDGLLRRARDSLAVPSKPRFGGHL